MKRIGKYLLPPKIKEKFELLLNELEVSMKGLYAQEWIDQSISWWREKFPKHFKPMSSLQTLNIIERDIEYNNWIRETEEHSNLLECHCCGYMTLTKRGNHADGYPLCPVCAWEDEPDLDLDTPSGPNRNLTLKKARENFERTGAIDSEIKHIVILNPEKYFKKKNSI